MIVDGHHMRDHLPDAWILEDGRLKGSNGQPEALRLLKRQELVQDSERAGFLLSKGELVELEPDTHLIIYGEASSDGTNQVQVAKTLYDAWSFKKGCTLRFEPLKSVKHNVEGFKVAAGS